MGGGGGGGESDLMCVTIFRPNSACNVYTAYNIPVLLYLDQTLHVMCILHITYQCYYI